MALLIIAAVSGTGKSTVARQLLARNPNLQLSVSHTTRAPRPGEVDGREYHFADRATFDRMIAADAFVEWAEYAGNRYGTARSTIDDALDRGIDLLFDVEVVGAANLKAAYPEAASCFLLPPSWGVLEQRLRGRRTEDEGTVARRLATGLVELEAAEGFDYLVVNDDLDRAITEVEAVYQSARLKTVGRRELLLRLRREAAARAPNLGR